MKELLGYVFSPLRGGDLALYRGSGKGLAPILLVAAVETSLSCIARLEHEYALKAELDADSVARPVALMRYKERMTLVLEDPGGAPVEITRFEGGQRIGTESGRHEWWYTIPLYLTTGLRQ